MEDKINNIIPAIFAEIESDGENDSDRLLGYYQVCNQQERTAINEVMIYLCGWGFETILEKCGIKLDASGNPIEDPDYEPEDK